MNGFLSNYQNKTCCKFDKMNIFEILNESKDCEVERLKSKCQKLIKEHHPDKNFGEESERFLQIMKVWQILNDPKKLTQEKSNNLTQKKANWDTITLQDMNYDEENYVYYRDCRCGDRYNLPKEELNCDSEFCVECETCSNTITVTTETA